MSQIPEKIDSKFRFVLVAAQRAEQLMRGARPHLDPGNAKPTRIAQQEVQREMIAWDYGPSPAAESADTEEPAAAAEEAEEEEVH